MTGSGVGQRAYADAAAALAGRVLDAVRGGGEVDLAGFLDSCADAATGLGAVRVVGADVFAPHLVLGRPLAVEDQVVVARSLDVFPAVAGAPARERGVAAWRDWATARLLDLFAGAPVPSTPSSADPPTSPEAAALPDVDTVLGPAADWPRWSVVVAQLSPLAQPTVDGPVAPAVAREALALARGATRAVLRRDHVTAARLARWVALLSRRGVEAPLDPWLLTEQLRLNAGAGPRMLLDLAIARHLLGGEPA
ncbi:hypothetical protein [Saccharothrix sp. HUAS TT1]|uniref:hypothetical protein n=1 Tax=unclassified Saccharothrix TaxID=2593673 RepID=UPI00345C0AB8